jgi:hypothetical protein
VSKSVCGVDASGPAGEVENLRSPQCGVEAPTSPQPTSPQGTATNYLLRGTLQGSVNPLGISGTLQSGCSPMVAPVPAGVDADHFTALWTAMLHLPNLTRSTRPPAVAQ